jgi:hypothetical protein
VVTAFPPEATDSVVIRLRRFKQDNAYFPLAQKAMINLQVDDLDGLLDRLIDEGVTVDPKRESYDFGKFGWITKSCRALAACLN